MLRELGRLDLWAELALEGEGAWAGGTARRDVALRCTACSEGNTATGSSQSYARAGPSRCAVECRWLAPVVWRHKGNTTHLLLVLEEGAEAAQVSGCVSPSVQAQHGAEPQGHSRWAHGGDRQQATAVPHGLVPEMTAKGEKQRTSWRSSVARRHCGYSWRQRKQQLKAIICSCRFALPPSPTPPPHRPDTHIAYNKKPNNNARTTCQHTYNLQIEETQQHRTHHMPMAA
jgi:hypothetical protein